MRIEDIYTVSRVAGFEPSELDEFIKYYNTDYSAYGNEIYENILSRFAHTRNYLTGSWFSQRIDLMLSHAGTHETCIDLGYSIPYPIIADKIYNLETKFVYVDKEESAKQFYDYLVSVIPHPDRKDDIALVADIQSDGFADLALSHLSNNKSTMISAVEVIEHLEEPMSFWVNIQRISQQLENPSLFCTLPIGPQIPSHTMTFSTLAEAEEYLTNFMDVDSLAILAPPTDKSGASALNRWQCICAYGTPK